VDGTGPDPEATVDPLDGLEMLVSEELTLMATARGNNRQSRWRSAAEWLTAVKLRRILTSS